MRLHLGPCGFAGEVESDSDGLAKLRPKRIDLLILDFLNRTPPFLNRGAIVGRTLQGSKKQMPLACVGPSFVVVAKGQPFLAGSLGQLRLATSMESI